MMIENSQIDSSSTRIWIGRSRLIGVREGRRSTHGSQGLTRRGIGRDIVSASDLILWSSGMTHEPDIMVIL